MSHRASLYLLFLLAFVSVMVFCCIEGEIYVRQTNELEKQVRVFYHKVNTVVLSCGIVIHNPYAGGRTFYNPYADSLTITCANVKIEGAVIVKRDNLHIDSITKSIYYVSPDYKDTIVITHDTSYVIDSKEIDTILIQGD